MNDVLIIVLLIVLIIAAMIGLPYWLMKRSIGRVIKIFRRVNAVDPSTAKTVDELGLRRRTLLQGMFRARDYKPQALDILLRAEIIQITEDDKLYLSEEKLAASGMPKR